MNFLLLVSTKPEWAELKKRFVFERMPGDLPLWKSEIHGHNVTLLQIGIGGPLALERLEQFNIPPPLRGGGQGAGENFHPLPNPPPSRGREIVIHFGFSGALIAKLKVGDIVTSSFFTSPVVLETPEQKREAHQKTGAIAVDMESSTVAAFCQKQNWEYIPIRAIFDTVDCNLKNLNGDKTIDSDGNPKILPLIKQVIKKPQLIMQLPQFQKAASLCSKNLADEIEKTIQGTRSLGIRLS